MHCRALSSVLLLWREHAATAVGCISTISRREKFNLLLNVVLMLDQEELDQLGAYCDKGHVKI